MDSAAAGVEIRISSRIGRRHGCHRPSAIAATRLRSLPCGGAARKIASRARRDVRLYSWLIPPSITISVPTMKPDSGEAR
jgi:hypothetical protein